MSDGDAGTYSASEAFGVFLVLAGVLAVLLTGEMQVSGFTASHDPGPDALPKVLGYLLIVGGAVEIVRNYLKRRERSADRAPISWAGVIVLFQVVLYVVLLPVLGFSLSTGCFTIALLRWFGASWRLTISVALSLILIVNVLFTHVFEVVLPAGRLGLPF